MRRRDSGGARPDAASPRPPRRALLPGEPVRPPFGRALAAPGTLQLTTEPWAEVILDGRSLGYTPRLHRIELPAGERRLRLRNPLCRPEVLQVKVRSGELIVRHVRLEVLPARATIRGPAGWAVYLEGRKLGVLPLPIVNVEHGDHTVLIVGPSGQSLKRRFRATAGESLTVELLESR